jgi:CheY-like chemotaxis protein
MGIEGGDAHGDSRFRYDSIVAETRDACHTVEPRPTDQLFAPLHGQENDKKNALASGFQHHLTKPVDIKKLTILVELSVRQ